MLLDSKAVRIGYTLARNVVVYFLPEFWRRFHQQLHTVNTASGGSIMKCQCSRVGAWYLQGGGPSIAAL